MDELFVSELLKKIKSLWYNENMKTRWRGFTMIEVALFLAVSGALFLAVAVGVSNSIYQQRFNDSVQNFAEFLRSAYAGTENVENILGEGRSEKAIYGKLVVFGETEDLAGGENSKKAIYMYDVIGDVKGNEEFANSGVLGVLTEVGAGLVIPGNDETEKAMFAGAAESYTPKWAARIEDKDGEAYKGALLIVRHPRSGTIYTLAYKGEELKNLNKGVNDGTLDTEINQKFTDLLNNESFKAEQVGFCVNPNDSYWVGVTRRAVLVAENSRNSSGIIIDAAEDNLCMEK